LRPFNGNYEVGAVRQCMSLQVIPPISHPPVTTCIVVIIRLQEECRMCAIQGCSGEIGAPLSVVIHNEC
jgi:hypothetical protein